jgi:hypothetical protein
MVLQVEKMRTSKISTQSMEINERFWMILSYLTTELEGV